MKPSNLTFILVLLIFSSGSFADTSAVDALVKAVKQESLEETSRNQARLDSFIQARDDQMALLEQARQELEMANNLADSLRVNYEDNEKALTQAEADLRERSGDLQDLFAIVRQVAVSTSGTMKNSLVSGEFPRDSFLDELGISQSSPSIEDITRLWTDIFTEISESGKVVTFNASVINPDGQENQEQVTRVGVFTAVSNGAFLRFLPDSGKFVELSRQPPPRFQMMAANLETAEELTPMALDPSKGAILSLMVQSPSLLERIRQGGGIGYLILALGVLGLFTVIRRSIGLLLTNRAVAKQAKSEGLSEKNALGRLRKVIRDSASADTDTMEVLLDEQLAEEATRLNRGLPLIAVLAATSPLLGLLGTVTGMIETFQSITLFGTGDPKLMSGGISQALITTQLGLAVAIPLILFHSMLSGRVNRMVEKLGKHISEMISERELA